MTGNGETMGQVPAPLAGAIVTGMGVLVALAIDGDRRTRWGHALRLSPAGASRVISTGLAATIVLHVLQAEAGDVWARRKGWTSTRRWRLRRRTWLLGMPSLVAARRADKESS